MDIDMSNDKISHDDISALLDRLDDPTPHGKEMHMVDGQQYIIQYLKILKIEPNNVRALLALGTMYVTGWNGVIHRYPEAIDCFKKIVEIKPNNADVVSSISKVLMNNSIVRYPRTEEIMEKIVESNPNNADAWDALGWVYQNQKSKKLGKSKQCHANARKIESTGKP